ncbi:S8 family serine peptidase [Paucibacter soli]|uniref:S8 family serine peptidase n=1 Tax=Paucibacter soli TaxID=3133433 RepID=UPI0030B30C7C
MLAVLSTLPMQASMAASAASVSASSQARVIVRFKPGAQSVRAKILAADALPSQTIQVAQTRGTALGLRSGLALTHVGRSLDTRTHVYVAAGIDAAALAKRLAADAEVELVAVDRRRRATALPNDPLFAEGNGAIAAGQWYLRAPDSTVISSINAVKAWNSNTGSAVVAVLDTGVRYEHPDLASKLLPGYDLISEPLVANDGGMRDSDASDPGDGVSQADVDGPLKDICSSSDVSSSSWHGTRVSGLIGAASDNGIGIAGVSWGSKILPVRVLGRCGGYDSDIMAGMRWAAGVSVPGLPVNSHVARVLNMSLGSDGSCAASDPTGQLYRETIAEVGAKGALVIAAAGNNAGQAVGIPANCPGVLAVGALRHVGTKVGFSAMGPEVGLSAPGGNCVNETGACLYSLVTTSNSGTQGPLASSYTDSNANVGTSFSAPLVSGTAALLLSTRPSLSVAELVNVLKSTSRPFPARPSSATVPQCAAPTSTEQLECYCSTATCGAGMLDAGAAVEAVAAANNASVQISAGAAAVAGQTLTLSASALGLASGRTVASSVWSIVDGGGIVSGFASQSGMSASVTPSAAGSFSVKLTLTDDLGFVYAGTLGVTVAPAPVVSSGGGGAMQGAWLLALLACVPLLRRARR